jgi:flagellar P-ring protein precursor FlgI
MNTIRLLIALLFAASALSAQVSVKIKDVTRVGGVRDNQLVGYGLVVGLNGRGDSAKSKVTRDTAANLFQKFQVRVDPSDIVSRNIAAVIVTATLPAFCESGSRIDVKVSSVGDASSIENGELLQTALLAADGKIYAVVQGTVVTVYKDGNDVAGKMTAGYIPNGALVERVTASSFVENGNVRLVAEQPDFTTIRNIVTAVNDRFGAVASAKDNSSVSIAVPAQYAQDIPRFLAEVGELEIEPGTVARVVIDRRSGTVVMGGDVKVGAVAVSQKKMSLEIGPPPSAFLDELNERKNANNSFALEEASDVKTIVEGLNRMGARTEDIISIMRALKAAGALHAQLIIL